jgi:hypothetical protein
MILDMPYFMTNEEWYYFDWNEMIYKLTDKATQEAKESYEEYYFLKKYNTFD